MKISTLCLEADATAGTLAFSTMGQFTWHLLGADGVHLGHRGKRILVQELSGLTERALNCP